MSPAANISGCTDAVVAIAAEDNPCTEPSSEVPDENGVIVMTCIGVQPGNAWNPQEAVLVDWFGTDIVIESAVHPGGPYVEIERRRAAPKCADECTTYFSSWIDGQNLGGPNDVLISSLSHNRWDGSPSWVYRPTFHLVAPPPDRPTSAMRCELGHCR